jgi:HK97 gp10 family phage protein
MSLEVEGTLQGIDELVLKLRLVNDDMQFKSGRFALRKAGKILETAIIGEMMRIDKESTREAIWRNVKLRFAPRRFKRTGDLSFRIGILGGAKSRQQNAKNPGGDTFYWRFLEFGTERYPAQRYITNTAIRKQGAILPEFVLQYRKSLDRALKRQAKLKKIKANVGR